MPARAINPEDFMPKNKPTTVGGGTDLKEDGFLNLTGRREQFLSEHERYNENKLEQEERRELYYCLEQMFESSKNVKSENDPMN